MSLNKNDFKINSYHAALLKAKEQVEQQFIFSVLEQAMSAESGTDSLGFENIVGVGIGRKMINGQYTEQDCIKVYVAEKAALEQVDIKARIPKDINWIPTDIVATGEIHALSHKGRYRAVPGGVSVGHFLITVGTVGCMVKDSNNQLYLSNNNHILADCNRAKIGDSIVQPGVCDGGKVPADVIGKLSHFVPIKFYDPETLPENLPENYADCAIVKISPEIVRNKNKCFGELSDSITPCSKELLVKKCGRITQLTHGIITDCNALVKINYGTSGMALFKDQIVIQSTKEQLPFSDRGDSGSLIVTEQGNNPVALLFAGSRTHTVAASISTVLGELSNLTKQELEIVI
ncbi:hypothetical protein [Candidatus Magnetominusculus xianensis]|uniref:Peptidase S1 domain-containing protein n=1 Tax=Candidatus Magnetominusculus xianensis TaxID=1748249 RepID=A0ABR5SJR6_9BACT|nr:hypothetical protein [Candidatus Magnetominusculus xianensis]KWT92721.1 hypothetical protein ASN18_0552 [Candidatus Magnetominusculus xianensis]MBF0403728.1 hypothetical protein [Nitrospirota bacterium]